MSSTLERIVFLTSELPYPPSGGGKIRDMHLIRLLAERADVEVLCFKGPRSHTGGHPAEQPPSNVRVSEVQRDRAPIWKRTVYPFRPYVVNGYSQEMEKALKDRARPGTLLWVSRLAMAQYIPVARKMGYQIVLDEHNVESNLLLKSAVASVKTLPNLLIAAQCSYYESRFCQASDVVVATSDIDASRLSKMAPGSTVHVVPNSIDAQHYEPIRGQKGHSLFFSGTLNYGPNVEALEWFCKEILPRLRAALGKKMPPVVVAGSNPSHETVRMLKGSGIEVHSNPPSMLPFLSDAAVVFVPIKSGSGTRFKILEAMAAGRPVVSTGKGAEGLVLSPTYDIWIADDADRFASGILQLFANETLRREMGSRAAETVQKRYDWRCVRHLMQNVLAGLSPRAAKP